MSYYHTALLNTLSQCPALWVECCQATWNVALMVCTAVGISAEISEGKRIVLFFLFFCLSSSAWTMGWSTQGLLLGHTLPAWNYFKRPDLGCVWTTVDKAITALRANTHQKRHTVPRSQFLKVKMSVYVVVMKEINKEGQFAQRVSYRADDSSIPWAVEHLSCFYWRWASWKWTSDWCYEA